MVVETAEKKNTKRYYYAVGRRKTATAQVRLYEKGKGEIIINNKDYTEYFPTVELQNTVVAPLELVGLAGKIDVSAIVKGGGIRGQAEAIRHGIARALIKINEEEYRKILRAEGYLTRDPRAKERKKPGLKRARRAPQWSKR